MLGLRAPVGGSRCARSSSQSSFVMWTGRLRATTSWWTERAPSGCRWGAPGCAASNSIPISNSFLLFTGAALNDENAEFRLLEWSGRAGAAAPREISRYSRKLKPEGITPVQVAGRDAMLVVFDVGYYEVVWGRGGP